MKRVVCVLLTAVLLFSLAAFSASAEIIYIQGDSNGDGYVTVLDATQVQQLIAGIITDKSGMVSRRGNVTGGALTVEDATEIQRYAAMFDTPYKIGKKVSYDEYELPFIPN